MPLQSKAPLIWMFMIFISGSALTTQFILGDIFGVEFLTPDGEPIKSNILAIIDIDDINVREINIIEGNFTENTTNFNRVENSAVASAYVAWEALQLVSGTYIFQILILFGMPELLVAFMVIVYVFLLGYFIWTAVRGT